MSLNCERCGDPVYDMDDLLCFDCIDLEDVPLGQEDKYYILSIKWSRNETFVWYRENSSGYCERLDWAGVYTKEEADKRTMDGVTMAVPVPEARRHAVSVVPIGGTILDKVNESTRRMKEELGEGVMP